MWSFLKISVVFPFFIIGFCAAWIWSGIRGGWQYFEFLESFENADDTTKQKKRHKADKYLSGFSITGDGNIQAGRDVHISIFEEVK